MLFEILNLLTVSSILLGIIALANYLNTNYRLLKVKYLTDKAYELTRGSSDAAGLDLCSAYTYTIPPLSRVLINTDLSITVPDGTYGRIAPRSGLAKNNGIDVLAGVIDPDYTGPVGVILFNSDSSTPFQINPGDRIAQLILEKYESNIIITSVDYLDETTRGLSGFGSTGIEKKRD
jgi:dUTP pyrophosphatase